MSDAAGPGAAAVASPGALLRQAREHKGLSIAALAAGLKVTPAKLEALEADRFGDLPDVAFARALSLAVCRALKVDPAPVLAALPRPKGQARLEQVAQGLNTPFLDRPGRPVPGEWSRLGASPLVWLSLLVLVAAGFVYFLPGSWLTLAPAVTRIAKPATSAPASTVETVTVAPASATPVAAASGIASTPVATLTETVYSVPLGSVGLPASGPAGSAASPLAGVGGSLQVRARAESWIEVSDAQGQALVSRIVSPGESVGLDGAMPLKVRIGNAAGTEVVFRGQPFELAPHTRDNVARFELK